MAEWQNLDLSSTNKIDTAVSGLADIITSVTDFIGLGIEFLDLMSSYLDISQNPYLSLFKTILDELVDLLDSLNETSLNGLFITPIVLEDIEFFKGGYGMFRQMLFESFHDREDPNRPQHPSSSYMGGLLLYMQTKSPADLIRALFSLLSYFGRPFDLRYPVPVEFKVMPCDAFGQAVHNITNYFSSDHTKLEHLRLEWQEPRMTNDVFLDIFASNKFYIERSKDVVGKMVVRKMDTGELLSALEKKVPGPNYVPVLDDNGLPKFVWEPLNPNDPFLNPLSLSDYLTTSTRMNFLAGRYAYVVDNVEKGSQNGYYYRVRSVPYNTSLRPFQGITQTSDGIIEESTLYRLELDGRDIEELCPPSLPAYGMVPDVDNSFDMPSAILNLFRMAYLLRMDTDVYDSNGNLLEGSSYLKTPISDMVYLRLSSHQELVYEEPLPDGSFKVHRTYYWENGLFEEEEPILSYEETLQRNEDDILITEIDPFSGVDELLVKTLNLKSNEILCREIDLRVENKIPKIVKYLMENEDLFLYVQNKYRMFEHNCALALKDGIDPNDILSNSQVRLDLLDILRNFERHTPQGTPPNWEAVSLIEDIFPYLGDINVFLINLIRSLTNTFQSSLDQLKATIQGARDRIVVVVELIKEIEDLINKILDLARLPLDLNYLWIEPGIGGVSYFINEVRNASNNPDASSNQYMSGIALTFGGPSLASIANIVSAFNLVFGV